MVTPIYFKRAPHSTKAANREFVIVIVRWPDQGTPQNFGETILLHFLIDMMVLIKNQEGVEL